MAITTSANVKILSADADELTGSYNVFMLSVDGAVAGITDSDGSPIWTDQAAAAQITFGHPCTRFHGIKRGAGAGTLYVWLA